MTNNFPIFILGCPRSGTLLTSRILGRPENHFLITEHKNKAVCAEDRSGINDSKLLWNIFEYKSWNAHRNRPSNEEPIYDKRNLARLKSIYENLAGSRRLVVKNPSNLARIPLIREMFPDANFVFCIRNLWQTAASISSKATQGEVDHDSFHLRTEALAALSKDFLLRAIHSWSEAVEMYCRYKDERWTTARYEDVVQTPTTEINRLYRELAINDKTSRQAVAALPRRSAKSCYAIKEIYDSSPHRLAINKLLAPGCRIFDYPVDFDTLDVSAGGHYREKFSAKRMLKYCRRLVQRPITRPEKAGAVS
jgi:hypothetical protein